MAVALVQEPERVRVALSPLRRQLLERLREPGSATQLANELGLPRQRLNYHLRALEDAELVELVEERPRRGFRERILATSADAFVVDPSVIGEATTPPPQDRFAAEHLIATAADVIRDVAGMQAEGDRKGTRLLTFTIEAELTLASPVDVEHFTTDLAEAVAGVAEDHNAPGGRRYRIVIGGHPA
jgi:DNA-binding transcriptional ArsR family regulator